MDRCRRILATERCRESGAAERLRPLSTHNLPSIASRPPKFVGLLSPNIGDRTTRGENGAAERLYPLPAHGLSPQYSQPASEICRTAVAGYLRQHNTGRATQQNVCTHYGLPDIVGRPPKSAGLLPPDIGGRTTRGENGAAERLCLLPAHNLPSITGRPSVGLCRLAPTRLLRL